jgi:HSP20 family protein
VKKKTTKKPDAPGDAAEVEFGGLFRGLGDFVNLLSKLAETGEELKERDGEFRVKGLGDNARGVYGFSIRSGVGGGKPHVQPFGNMRTSDAGLVVDEVREPLVDIFDEDSEVVITAELPGVLEGEIEISVEGDVVTIETKGERYYAKEIQMPEAVSAKSLRQSYNNGVLEVRVKKATQETRGDANGNGKYVE